MSKPTKYCVFLACGAVAGLLLRSAITKVHAQGVTSRPFTATYLRVMQNGSGQEVREIVTFARRADGRAVERRDSVNGDAAGVKSIVDPVVGTRTVVDPITQSTTTYHRIEPGWA